MIQSIHNQTYKVPVFFLCKTAVISACVYWKQARPSLALQKVREGLAEPHGGRKWPENEAIAMKYGG